MSEHYYDPVEIWSYEEREGAYKRIAELEAEVTKCHELQDSYCDRIAELEHDLTNKEIEYTDLWDDALAFQSRIAELEAALSWKPKMNGFPRMESDERW